MGPWVCICYMRNFVNGGSVRVGFSRSPDLSFLKEFKQFFKLYLSRCSILPIWTLFLQVSVYSWGRYSRMVVRLNGKYALTADAIVTVLTETHLRFRRRTTIFEAYNQAYAAANTRSPKGAECIYPPHVYPKDNLQTGCAHCKGMAFQCLHGLFCFSLMDFANYNSLCRLRFFKPPLKQKDELNEIEF